MKEPLVKSRGLDDGDTASENPRSLALPPVTLMTSSITFIASLVKDVRFIYGPEGFGCIVLRCVFCGRRGDVGRVFSQCSLSERYMRPVLFSVESRQSISLPQSL